MITNCLLQLLPRLRWLQASRRAPGENGGDWGRGPVDDAAISTLRSIIASAALLTLPAVAQDHRFEADPVVTVRENFVACDVLFTITARHGKPAFSASR
jgi:hypothetical protein